MKKNIFYLTTIYVFSLILAEIISYFGLVKSFVFSYNNNSTIVGFTLFFGTLFAMSYILLPIKKIKGLFLNSVILIILYIITISSFDVAEQVLPLLHYLCIGLISLPVIITLIIKDKISLQFYSQIIIMIICLFFAYKGYFPFNTGVAKNLHYWVYDNYHIAFNHSNVEYKNGKYWCKKSIREYYNFEIKYNEYQLNEINNNINSLTNSKYKQQELNFENNIIEKYFDRAHISGNMYYYNKGMQQQQNLYAKYKYNRNIDEQVQQLENKKKNILDEQNKIIFSMLEDNCVKVIN